MRRLWLLFSQFVTVLLALWFVVLTLKPQWPQDWQAAWQNGDSIMQKTRAMRPGGEIGRRTRFRFWRRKAWGFKSLHPHQVFDNQD